MPTAEPTSALHSFRKQDLLLEFSSIRYAPLDGLFVSITPGDPALWVGVIFVRKGPYSSAVLRFQISFPPTYPALPPLITFSTDVFHPLLTPLTTYTYTTGSSDADTVSATDEERLPPGGFSLRHGFPHWFGRSRKSAASSRNVSGSGIGSPNGAPTPSRGSETADLSSDLASLAAVKTNSSVSMLRILEYIRSTFSDEAVLDAIPFEAAANPGAYHAWQAFRAGRPGPHRSQSPKSTADETPLNNPRRTPGASPAGRNRRPGEWNWEGVWEERVKKAIKASLSEPALFAGASTGDDIIRFRDCDEETVAKMKEQWKSILPGATGALLEK